MNAQIEQLVSDTIDLTGADAPDLLAEDSPALAKPTSGDGEDFYLIGLIGGKDVGKSSFVNALVGQQITQPTSHGAGTQTVVAYAHRDAADALEKLLRREVPGRFSIHPHSVDRLRRQVLLDLPDIDSIYDSHIQITRSMLRHMLYPIWIQSIEKYADQQPQKLLARVAEGNDPLNFVFCLNKVDQLIARESASAAGQLRDDYAARLAKLLKLSAPPKVHLVSATHPAEHDLPALRAVLSQEKSAHIVKASQELAGRRQSRSVLAWLDAQQLAARADRAQRLLDDAQELVASRLAVPLLEEAIPALADDPAHRMAMTEPVTALRMSRWPIVNVVHTVLLPLTSLLRANVAVAPGAVNLDAYLMSHGQTLAGMIQTTFAQLQQSSPAAGALYRGNKLWEDMPAELSATNLRRRIAATIERQRAALADRIAGRSGIIAPIFRVLLTIGAVLWFPIIQPLLAIVAAKNWVWSTLDVARLAIELFSAMYLLRSVGFLVLYFIVLWAILRWDTQRRVNRMIERWKRADIEPALSLTAQTLEWIDELLEPIRSYRDQLSNLAERVEKLRDDLGEPRSAAA